MAAAWLLPQQSTLKSDELLEAVGEYQLVVPHIWEAEISNVLLVQIRRGKLTLAQANGYMGYLKELEPRVHPLSIEQMFGEVFPLAHQFGMSSYDAIYLSTALSLGLPLATLDQKLQSAAKSCGIKLA